jgi:SAM-dependent methyltransferase
MLSTPRRIKRDLHYLARLARYLGGVRPRECPCCGYRGMFKPYGFPPRFDALCRACYSLERHRLFVLLDQRHHFIRADGDTLHFAPEPQVAEYLKRGSRSYRSADIGDHRAELRENIESTSFPDASFEQIVCSHVLEHVDDSRALHELFRILKPNGAMIAMVPIIEGWDTTYEDATIVDPREREVHFGQDDHVRFYGRDFRDRVRSAGFELREYTAEGADVVRYALSRGEKIFVCVRPASALAEAR